MIIGVCGGTASGKTIFSKRIVEIVGSDLIIYLEHDAYYKGLDELPPELKEKKNFDHPDSLENDLFIKHLKMLQANQPIERPVYDFTKHQRTSETYRIEPKPVILVDGILLFAIKKLRQMFDIKVYIDAEADIRLARRLQRDIFERGRSTESVLEQYFTTVRPMHELFVEPSKNYADVIIHGKVKKHNTGLDLLVTKIKAYLSEIETKKVAPALEFD
jgi:uridine kinase